MKLLITIIAIFVLGTSFANGQSYYKKQWERKNTSGLSIGATTIRSVRGWERGFELSFNTAKNFQAGVFSYQDDGTSETEPQKYQGLLIGFPLVSIKDELRLGMEGRLGLHNERFMSFLSTLKLAYELNKKIELVSSVGVSERLPVFAFKMNFRLTSTIR